MIDNSHGSFSEPRVGIQETHAHEVDLLPSGPAGEAATKAYGMFWRGRAFRPEQLGA